MCLAAFALHAHPQFPLVVAANRDEFYARPTRAAAWWADAPELWAGRDLDGGGTWMGFTRRGRVALLTNVREPGHEQPGAITRGALVAEYLRGDGPPGRYLAHVAEQRARYNGFNLVCGSLGSAGKAPSLWGLHHAHGGADPAGRVVRLRAGLHGLSNAAFGTPWPKVSGLVRDVGAALGEHRQADTLAPALLAALADHAEAPDALLPDTGVGLDWERRLSARFIGGAGARAAGYGTRASTVLLVGADGEVRVEERTFGPGGAPAGEAQAAWTLPG